MAQHEEQKRLRHDDDQPRGMPGPRMGDMQPKYHYMDSMDGRPARVDAPTAYHTGTFQGFNDFSLHDFGQGQPGLDRNPGFLMGMTDDAPWGAYKPRESDVRQ